jgi:hypothetical protein
MAAIDDFMAAIRAQESGGNYTIVNLDSGASGAYQFTFGTWQEALSLAGLVNTVYYREAANLAPASVQDAAARALITLYYNQFGQSWFNVAEAWYGGPGAVGHPDIGGGPGYPNVGQYAAQVVARMGNTVTTPAVNVPAGLPELIAPMTDQFASDVGWHYLNVIEPLWAQLSSYTSYTLSNLVTPPSTLV